MRKRADKKSALFYYLTLMSLFDGSLCESEELKLAGTGDSFGALLNLEFVEYPHGMPP